jgi:hypothetical protein
MLLIGGEWLHTDCAEQMAQAITPSPYAYPYVNEERRARLRRIQGNGPTRTNPAASPEAHQGEG